MPTLRERIGWGILGKGELGKLAEGARVLSDAIRLGPLTLPPDMMLERLSELDSRYLDFLVRQLQYSTALIQYEASEDDRIRTIYTSRRLYDNDVLTEAIVDIWTDFGFGLNVQISPRAPAAKKVWDEFWKAPRNQYVFSQRDIHKLSKDVLVDGDFLFVFFTDKLTGLTSVRTISSIEIKGGPSGNGIITAKEDNRVPVLYRREVIVNNEPIITYYKDWRVTEKELAGITEPKDGQIASEVGTEIMAMLVAHRVRTMRGWPLMTTGFPWSVAYRDFLQDRAAVARAVAMYVDKLVVKGGQRAVDAIAAKLQSAFVTGADSETNPRPVAGSTWIENEAATRERMPLTSGATDANVDGSALIAQAALAGRIYPHWVGKGDAFRLATATSMERPLLKAFNRYQLFWSSVWQDMARHVFTMRELYGPRLIIKNKDVDVSTDSVIDTSIADVASSGTMLGELWDRGMVDEYAGHEIAEQLLRVVLQTLGVSDVEDIFSNPAPVVKKPEPIPGQEPPEGEPEEEPAPGDDIEAVVPKLKEVVDRWNKTLAGMFRG